MHPEAAPPGQRQANLSPLMRAKQNATTGDKVNFCQFGCGIEELDDNGYCHHLIGFTNDGKTYEPMVMMPTGRRAVQVQLDRDGKPALPLILKDDKTVKITTSSRVYRDVKKHTDAMIQQEAVTGNKL